MEKFIEYLEESGKRIATADHLLYVTFPLINEKRLLLKILEEINFGIANCLNSILQYEYLFKKIRLSSDPKQNLEIFKQKCAPRFSITPREVKSILELFEIMKAHKKSPFEFVRDEKIVILSENMSQKIINLEKTKEFLASAKSVLEKTKKVLKSNFSR
ncbi:MAG: hypothetical protein KJ949_00220 [Nanoarchaeota archaeon]|nr:hypothetical protein [Nanoarchaeota archaeon]MBU4308659.1 hypothetical protein [Nanoarchaeota archaeon]